MEYALELMMSLVVLGLMASLGYKCLFRTREFHEQLLTSYRREDFLSRIDPFRWLVESSAYPLLLKVTGVTALGGVLLGLAVLLGLLGRRH